MTNIASFERPSTMGNFNNEGFTISPICASDMKSVYWCDDSLNAGHAIRESWIPCGAWLTSSATPSASPSTSPSLAPTWTYMPSVSPSSNLPIILPWPIETQILIVDLENEFPPNLSGLKLTNNAVNGVNNGVMWAVNNDPPRVYQLKFNGTYWLNVAENNWSNGKTILYLDGTEQPDAEDITVDDQVTINIYIYVCMYVCICIHSFGCSIIFMYGLLLDFLSIILSFVFIQLII
jgi:hypothetical protein